MAQQQRHPSHQQEEAGLLFHLLEHIKGCSNPKASPAGIKWSSFTQQQLYHGKQIPPCAGEPAMSHVFIGIAPKPSPFTPIQQEFSGRAGSPQGKKKTHTEAHIGCPDQHV